MNVNLKKIILCCISICAPLATQVTTQLPKKQIVQPAAKKNILTKPKSLLHTSTPCAKPAEIPYAQEFKTSNLPADQKQRFTAAWGNLYAAYLAKNASTAQNSNEWQALKRKAFINNPFCEYTPLGQNPEKIKQLDVCLDAHTKSQEVDITDCQTNVSNAYTALTTNYLSEMQAFLASKTFTSLPNDPANIRYNYAKYHLSKALNRLSKSCSITLKDDQPIVNFSGNLTDLGIIVNITNNSDHSFCVTDQDSTATPIAHLKHGLNGVNLYTAALHQDKSEESSLPPCFSFFQLSPDSMDPINNQPLFTIGMYTGAQLVNLLKTLPRKDQAIFEMNGCPTSEEYLANLNDIYMVLIQDPTPFDSMVRNQNQRIQAINLSVFTGPYVLTMQINETNVTQINPQTNQVSTIKIIQPALTTAQVIQAPSAKITASQANMEQDVVTTATDKTIPSLLSQNSSISETSTKTESINRSLLPLIILPKYVWDIPTMQLYWMLYSTSYIAALTDFSCFGAGNFGNAFEYFNKLGYFNVNSEYRFIIDRYNLLKAGETLFDCPMLMGCALYESSLQNCSDIPGIYSSENAKNNIVGNNNAASYLNFFVSFNPPTQQPSAAEVFNTAGFDKAYSMPYHQLYTLIVNLPIEDLRDSFFAKITKTQSHLYNLTWTNKQNKVLNSQTIYSNLEPVSIDAKFLTDTGNWQGTYLLNKQTPLTINKTVELKVIYSQVNNQHTLQAFLASPIDKISFIHTVEFSQYPLTDLYYDLLKAFNIAPDIRCYIFENGNLPGFLLNLTQEDWQSGIYVIPNIKDNDFLSPQNPGILTVTFYKSDGKTILGTIQKKQGLLNNTTLTNITEPMKIYNLYSKQFAPVFNAFLTAGVLLKYVPVN